jgi:alpha-ribazole phosphatase
MMKLYLIRHSMTEGNKKKRYIGTTDEPLCEEGIVCLKQRHYPQAERIYSSPLMRCMQTAHLIYPDQEVRVIPEFAECDFGLFENKNYKELSGCPEYQVWVDSGGTLPFPQGESREDFRKRSIEGVKQILKECREDGITCAALVVHGGTIMSIMEQYAWPRGDYYDYQIENGEGYELIVEDDDPGSRGIYHRFDTGGSEVDVSSGAADRTFDHICGTNYQRLVTQNENR